MDKPYKVVRRIVKTDYRRKRRGKNHQDRRRPRLDYIQLMNQGCNSYVGMNRNTDNREELKTAANQSPKINFFFG